MHLTFVDDSIAFDGYSPSSQPLGGSEKAFASLPPALARRGHEVWVFNRCGFKVNVDGSHWETWDGERPTASDVLIAHRLPKLLDFLPAAARKLLWVTSPIVPLDSGPNRALLQRHRPTIVFVSEAQRAEWSNPDGLRVVVSPPGLSPAYLEDEPMEPAEPPRVLCTTHPLAGLDGLLDLWTNRVRPAVPAAELHVYSALLDRGQLGAEVEDDVRRVLDKALAAAGQGVTIKRPAGDADMAGIYRQARLHLYPGAVSWSYAWTLAESQACGLPAVARASAAAAERIGDGQTGIVAANDDALVNAAINLLADRFSFDRMSHTARLVKRGRSWHVAAAEFESVLEPVPA